MSAGDPARPRLAPTPRALVLFAKAPVSGRVKTRLVPGLSPAAAAELQEALLLDTADVALEAGRADRPLRLWCAVAEDADRELLRALLPSEFTVVDQGPGDLGERLARVFALLLEPHASVLAIGADCPDLTPALLRAGFHALERSGSVLGAARDGGYWAIGLARPEPRLFQAIPWSTADVARRTRERARELGLEPEELPVLADLDRVEDLLAWARRPNPLFARTRAWCVARGLA